MRKAIWIVLLVPQLAFAQTRKEFWLKVNLTHRFDTKWSAGLDVQHRRQANFKTADHNIFHHTMANYVRGWVYYQLPRQWTLVLSPIGYFDNEDILNTAGELKQTNELRISPGIIKSFQWGQVKNKNRFLYDIRFAEFDKTSHFTQSRFRLQNNLLFPLFSLKKNQQFSYLLSNEVLIKKQKQVTTFDQDRLYNAVQWKHGPHDISLGYQWVVQKGTSNIFHRHQLYLLVNIAI